MEEAIWRAMWKGRMEREKVHSALSLRRAKPTHQMKAATQVTITILGLKLFS